MLNRLFIICLLFILTGSAAKSQISESVEIHIVKKESNVQPGQLINVPFFIQNNSDIEINVTPAFEFPEAWKVISRINLMAVKPGEKKFVILSFQVPQQYAVGKYAFEIKLINTNSDNIIASEKAVVSVNEIEKISMQLLESVSYVFAGETYKATYLIQNQGNTAKSVFIETRNCMVEGSSDIKLEPGETYELNVYNKTSESISEVKKEHVTVRALLSGEIIESIFQPLLIFPVNDVKKDMYFRFPISASATYLSTNHRDKYESAYQFEIAGNGFLDQKGNHKLDFVARGPDNKNLSFLGLYDQYYISYGNKNIQVALGDKSYSFTPLTESSRFGAGVESKIALNNGLAFGYLYVKPRFYTDIANEMAFYTEFVNKQRNFVSVYYILKENEGIEDLTYLASINSRFQPFKKTSIDLELSKGLFQGVWDNGFRTNISTQLSVFRFAGNYFYTGKNYPGYYSNSTFYSGNLTAQLTPKISLGLNARQDYQNAQLDTFFVTAPYSKAFQSYLIYEIAPRSYLKVFWRDYERKDRLALNKFHYKTNSLNTQFNQKFKKIDYQVLGEIGKTTNFILNSGENKQTTFRATGNISYRFNPFNAIRFFGGWSNINSFVSDSKRNVTAGLSVVSKITKNLNANFHVQNAFDIDDYYRNRNLMQLQLNYKFLRSHSIAMRSFYTLFRNQTDSPEFTVAATYTYKLEVPLKRILKVGDVSGRIVDENDEGREGVILHLSNRTAISDKNGDYSFRSVQTGKQLIFVDRTNFEMNEITNIPSPLEIEVVENRETPVNFRIVNGAKFKGAFLPEKKANNAELPLALHIIVEFENNFKQYRISTDETGEFSFPLVSPGKCTFKIYSNSIPTGYDIEKKVYNFDLKSGEQIDLKINLVPKKRNIIFKSQNLSLSNSATSNTSTLKLGSLKKQSKNKQVEDFYSVQIGAFRFRNYSNSKNIKGVQFDFEKRINNYNKYFIGHFSTYEEATKEKEKLKTKFNGAFVVRFKNNELVDIKNGNK